MRSRARVNGSAAAGSVMSAACAGLRRERAVHQRGKSFAHARLEREIHLCHGAAPAARHTLQNPSPVIHYHAVTVSLAPARMKAGLGRRHNITEILDRTRTQQ